MTTFKNKRKILIVDDLPDNVMLLNDVLLSHYEIIIATSGKEALQLATIEQPDLILLDIMMPGMDGYEVCEALKENMATLTIPVIFVTAMDHEENETRGLKIGAIDYITKPFNPYLVELRINNHMKMIEARELIEQQNNSLKELLSMREQVENITRHDMKTPLSGIINLPGLIAAEGNLNVDQMRYLKLIEKAGYRLLNIINLSLDLYKMENNTYQLHPVKVNLTQVIEHVITELYDQIKQRKVKVEIAMEGENDISNTPFFIFGEELLTYSMLSNLIKNAVEASPKNKTVRIMLKSGTKAQIVIHNQGVIPAAIRDNFFEKYISSKKIGGTGLGTYSARLMAETQNGEISFQTAKAQGTTLTVLLPIVK